MRLVWYVCGVESGCNFSHSISILLQALRNFEKALHLDPSNTEVR